MPAEQLALTGPAKQFCEDFGLEVPIVQAGMGFVSHGRLAGAVSAAGGLGTIATSGVMGTRELREHIAHVRDVAGNRPFAVNIVIPTGATEDAAFGRIDLARKHLDVCIELGVPVISTALGDPRPFIPELRSHGIKVIPTVGRLRAAVNCAAAGADAVCVEGHEAGGHIGPHALLYAGPAVVQKLSVPVLLAGCMATSGHVRAALDLGAGGVWVGTRFAASEESDGHPRYKQLIVEATEGSTTVSRALSGKPCRGFRNAFTQRWEGREVEILPYPQQAAEEYWRSRAGVLEGDVEEGFLGASECSALIDSVLPAATIVDGLMGRG